MFVDYRTELEAQGHARRIRYNGSEPLYEKQVFPVSLHALPVF